MTNKNIFIFDNSDLHIQENLRPDNIKFIFKNATSGGDVVPPKCDNFWKDVLPGQDVNFDCACIEEIRDSNDFTIDCEPGGGGEASSSILGQFKTSVGESVSYDIHGLEIYNTNAGEILTGDLFTNRTILNNIVAVDGSELYAQLYRDRELSFQAYSGEKFTQNMLFSAIAKLDPIVNVGESVSVSLSTQTSFSYTVDVGESSEAVVKYYPTYSMDAFVDVGEAVSTVLTLSRNFNADMTSGETQVTDIKFASNDNLSPIVEVGESVEFKLNSDINIMDVNTDIGEIVDVDLLTSQSVNIGLDLYTGEYVYTSVSFIPTISPSPITIGENLTSTFTTYPYYRLDPESMQSGENLDSFKLTGTLYANPYVDVGEDVDVNMEFDPYQGIPITVTADGESVEFNIFRNRLLYPDMINGGEEVSVSIQEYTSAKFDSITTAGETLSINLSADVYIGTFNAVDGQTMLKPTLYSLDNYVVNVGEYAEMSFAVDATLPVDIDVGESISFDLKRGEPANLPLLWYRVKQ